MGRGERQQQATSSGLLFGPRRERPTMWAQKTSDRQGAEEVERLLGFEDPEDFQQILAILSQYDETDPSMAPHLRSLIEGIAEKINQRDMPPDYCSELLRLVASKFKEDGSCPALEPLVDPLVNNSLFTSLGSPEDMPSLAELALSGSDDHAIPKKINDTFDAMATVSLTENELSNSAPSIDRLLGELAERDEPRAQALYDKLYKIESSWAPRWWGKHLQQAFYDGDQHLLARMQEAVRENPEELPSYEGVMQANPAVRQGIEQALHDWADKWRSELSPGGGLEQMLAKYKLPPLSEEEVKALDASTDRLVDLFAEEHLQSIGARSALAMRHEDMVVGALTQRARADLDGFCDQIGDYSPEHRQLRQQLAKLAQHRRLLPDHTLAEVVGEKTLEGAVREAVRRSDRTGPFYTGFSGQRFLENLIREAAYKTLSQ